MCIFFGENASSFYFRKLPLADNTDCSWQMYLPGTSVSEFSVIIGELISVPSPNEKSCNNTHMFCESE